MLQERRVEHGGVTFVVRELNVIRGMRRDVMRREAREKYGEVAESNSALYFLAVVTYPDVVTAVVEADGMDWPPSFEEFCELPESLVDALTPAAQELNPHWYPQERPKEEAAAESANFTGGS